MAVPHSDACFVKAYPGEATEAFCDGHVSGFSFFGGVPRSILYDNTRIAVARILGDGKRQRYTKQRGSLLWTTGTTANAGLNRIKWCIFTPASGVLLLRR